MIVSNVTPTELDYTQDRLLLMGSKVSFRDLYNKQIQLPVYKGKYYNADDVANLFVTINNILSTASKEFHKNKEITNALRTELEDTKKSIEQVDELKAELEKKDNELFEFISNSNSQLSEIQKSLDEKDRLIEQFKKERVVLAKAIRQLQGQNNN